MWYNDAMSKQSFILLTGIGFLVLVGAALLFAVAQTPKPQSEQSQKLRVAVTIYPLYDLVRQVAGNRADVALIVPPGALEHNFELTPKILSDLSGVKTIFAIGHGLDMWALQATNAIPGSSISVVDRGITIRDSSEKDEGPTDPHYWLHFGNAQLIADTVVEYLSTLDPNNALVYRENAENLKEDLAREKAELQAKLEPYRGAPILVFHDAWFYFAENFGLEIAGAFEPFVAEEPTPRHLAELASIVKEKNITTFFTEPQLSSTAIESFAEEYHLGIAVLDPLGGMQGRLTYQELMRYNAEQVLRAVRASKE